MTRSECPTCGGSIPIPWTGRPRTFCSTDCRREMARRRRELADLEEELVETRFRFESGWSSVNSGHVAWLEEAVEAKRAAIPEELQLSQRGPRRPGGGVPRETDPDALTPTYLAARNIGNGDGPPTPTSPLRSVSASVRCTTPETDPSQATRSLR